MGGAEPPRATYSLPRIKALLLAGRRIVTEEAARNLRALPLATLDMNACIFAPDERHESIGGHFYKTMAAVNPRAAARGLFQDVYRATYSGVQLYFKLQIEGDFAVVVQFKRR